MSTNWTIQKKWTKLDKFLETYSLPRLSQKETDNLNRLIIIIISETDSVKQTNKNMACKQKFRSVVVKTLCFHWGGMGSIPGPGTKIPHEAKKKNQFIFRDFPGGSGLNSFTEEFYQTQEKKKKLSLSFSNYSKKLKRRGYSQIHSMRPPLP